MVQLREILRQKLALERSNRQVARSLRVSPSTVSDVFTAARARGLDAAAVEALTDTELEALLYPKAPAASSMRPEPDCATLHLELRRAGVTLALLHFEYLKEHPDGLRYTAFCERYRAWQKQSSLVMRQVHVGGDKLFVDYAGMKPRIVDPTSGEVTEVELFVAVLGASNYTYAEASWSQQVPDFVASVTRTLTFIGGSPRAIVPDQLKSAVVKACRYDPGVQRTTAELGRYYDTTILPARPRSPRDKAKVEVGVQVAERWLLARIRNETFNSWASSASPRSTARSGSTPRVVAHSMPVHGAIDPCRRSFNTAWTGSLSRVTRHLRRPAACTKTCAGRDTTTESQP